MKLNVLMKKYYKFLHYQVGESQTCGSEVPAL